MSRCCAGVGSVLLSSLVYLATAVSGIDAGDTPPVSTRLDVNDISILWPVPKTEADVARLISVEEKLDDGTTAIWDADVFKKVMETAQAVTLAGSGNTTRQIRFDENKTAFELAKTWKIAGIRVDPSAPGCSEQIIRNFGSRPQIRLIVQPVTTEGTEVVVHDVTAHLVFDFVLGFTTAPGQQLPQAIPDRERFRSVLNDFATLKAGLAAAGVNTVGELGVHPALKAGSPDFSEKVRAILKKHLSSSRLNSVSFMGLDFPEPWIFFAMAKRNQGFVRVGHPSLGTELGQMLTFRDGDAVMPPPGNSTFGPGRGVSTAPLFRSSLNLTTPLITDSLPNAITAATLRDVPDIIANPQLAHFGNSDCVSCHSESTRRSLMRLQPTAFQYQRPAGVSGVDNALLPTHLWNVRNFGWFVNNREGGTTKESVATRTANEAAESVEFINREYFGNPNVASAVDNTPAGVQGPNPPPVRSVANALTLVMTIKSPADRAQLRALIQGNQQLPREQNPITAALIKLGNVHFARFVFMGDDKLLVITSYDDDFETYIKSFTREIGPVFDAILAHVKDAPPTPVKENVDKFLEYVKQNDLQCEPPFFSAYPQLRVQEIITLQKRFESTIASP